MANEPTINDNDFLVTTAKKAMELQVKEGDDFMPTVVMQYQTGETVVVLLAAGGSPFEVLFASAKDIVQAPLASISLTTDTYMWKGNEEDFIPGPLSVRFEAGDPDVSEAIQIAIAHTVAGEALTMGVTLPYERNRALHDITWNEEMRDATSHGGRIIDLLRAILLASKVL
jgi:hypothetical protein